MDVRGRADSEFAMTHARWQRYNRLLKQFEGWASSLRAGYGHDTTVFLEQSQLLGAGVADPEAAIKLLETDDADDAPYRTELVDQDDTELMVRVIETRTGSATTRPLRREMFSTPEYRGFVKVHGDLTELAGTPPFDLSLGKKSELALSFEDLRQKVLDLAREGENLQRFKGLGEMNPSQLFGTTMDPAKRTLQQVSIDDAAAADQVFSMLMGDLVEPRRKFIEDHARDVTNLDV